MRIIAGQFKSRQLPAGPPAGTRPTSDKLRETLFNILGETVRGCTFLDGCAGVGAVGIEAISRGAAKVVFVDRSRQAIAMIRQNLLALGIRQGFRILELDLGKALDVCVREGVSFDVAFVDPPYDQEAIYQDALQRFAAGPLLSRQGLVIMEHAKLVQLPEPDGNLKQVRTLQQGSSALNFYRPRAEFIKTEVE